MHHVFFIHSPVNGHLGCFHFLTIVNVHCCCNEHWVHLSYQGGSVGEESPCNAGDLGFTPRSGRSPGEVNDNPTPVFLLEESHEQRSMVGYSSWGHKKWVTTERLNLPT